VSGACERRLAAASAGGAARRALSVEWPHTERAWVPAAAPPCRARRTSRSLWPSASAALVASWAWRTIVSYSDGNGTSTVSAWRAAACDPGWRRRFAGRARRGPADSCCCSCADSLCCVSAAAMLQGGR
jgi:hypothetical protein